MSITTTIYGTWCSRVDQFSSSPDDTVAGFLTDWVDSYDIDAIKADYRAAIQRKLPPGVSLCGDEFIGPYYDKDKDFGGYPIDEYGNLDFAALIEGIDIGKIAERNELIDINEVAERLGYEGPTAAATARKRLSSWGVKRAAVSEHPESGRLQARFRSGEVDTAIAARPGRGARTDLKGA